MAFLGAALAQVEVVPVMTSIESCAPIGVPRVRRSQLAGLHATVRVGWSVSIHWGWACRSSCRPLAVV
jgi:hypothetical protein